MIERLARQNPALLAPQDRQPPLTAEGLMMTRLFFEIGPDPIDHPTIRAYSENTGVVLTRWQIEMLRRMNGILCECRNNAMQSRAKQAGAK